jgi:hypothetical protein
MDDPLAKYRHPGAVAPAKRLAVSPSGITLREYSAFESDASRCSLLLLKRGLVRKAATELALPYGAITEVISDGYGFGFSLTFALPFPTKAMVVEVRGEGLTPLLDGILRGTVRIIQIFDPERFFPPPEGNFDKQADEWRGPAMVKELTVTDKNTPVESSTRH